MAKGTGGATPDIIGMTSKVIVMTGRFLMGRMRRYEADYAERIMLVWKRQDVSVETKERGEDYREKLYPKLVSKSLQENNWLYKYSIPTGISCEKIRKSISDIEFDLKSKIIFKLLENDEEAHFSLTVPTEQESK